MLTREKSGGGSGREEPRTNPQRDTDEPDQYGYFDERADHCGLAQSTVSQHLKALKEAGLIIGEVDGPRTCYCIDKAALRRLKVLVAGL